MNAEISKLEAALLNLEEARLPLFNKIDEYNSLASAEMSRQIAALPGARTIIVRVIPASFYCGVLQEGVMVDGAVSAEMNTGNVEGIVRNIEGKYQGEKVPFLKKIFPLVGQEARLQRELCRHTVVTPVKEDHPHTHAYLFIARESGIYVAHVKYSSGAFIQRQVAGVNQLPALKEQVDCNKFEVTHPSRLAGEAYMGEFAAKHVYEKMKNTKTEK